MSVGNLSDTDYSRIILDADGLSVEITYSDDEAVLRIWHSGLAESNALRITGIQINRLRGMLEALGFDPT